MNTIYIDFEYIQTRDQTYYNLVCVVVHNLKDNSTKNWPIIFPEALIDFKTYLQSLDLAETLFIGWAISGAEVPCLIQIMGVDWVKKTKWVDDWVEYKMWVLTHPDFFNYSKKHSLASAIECLGLEDNYLSDKGATLALILYDNEHRAAKSKLRIETNNFHYSQEEMQTILFYCEQDVKILALITKKISLLSRLYNIEITLEQRLARGKFCMLSGVSYAMGNGFPMDIEKVKAIFSQRDKIKKLIQLECNKKSGYHLYMPEYKGPKNNKVLVKYTFCHENFTKYLTHHKLDTIWEKTEKGKQFRLDEDYLNEMLSNYKDILEPLYHARNTLKQLNSTDLSELMSPEGYIKCPPFPFQQKTSRSSPMPSKGFILNLAPWLRMMIKPAPGRAFVHPDFKAQEILVAAILSRDAQMLDSYLNDPYLSTAIKTGFAPDGATKKTHSHIRTPFKSIVLGTIYGRWVKSLTIIFMSLNAEWDQSKAQEEAVRYLDTHKQVFPKYWQFVADTYDEAMMNGYFQIKGESGWLYFVSPETKTTQLQNLPCQSFAAEMLRYAHDACVEQGINVIPHHDAFAFECAIEDAIPLAKRVSQIMCEQSKRLLGYDYMSTTTKIYTHEKPYFDKRGIDTYKFVMKELGFEIDRNFEDVKEFENIHLISEITL